MAKDNTMDWTNPEVRRDFQEEITKWRHRRDDWTCWQKIKWFITLFGLNLNIVLVFYGLLLEF